MDTEGPCADPDNPDLLSTWDRVDAAMDKLFDPAFRARHPDPGGGRLRVGWFFLTWTGFRTNPRRRDFGHHKVRDHYLARWGERLAGFGDEQCWHYHHPAASGIGNEWGLDFGVCREFDEILSRQALERDFFPVCYRAGGTIMDAQASRWVDAWFPFDYSNRAPVSFSSPPMDWSTGVADWGLYHPSPEDFRRPGSGRRRMARCLDLVSRIHSIGDEEIEAAFARAEQGLPAVLSCFDHDYRDIAPRLDDFRERLARVAARHPSVAWRYAAPVEAARRYLDAPAEPELEIGILQARGEVRVWSSGPLYQALPWLAVRGRDGSVRHVEEGLERVDARHWRWRPQDDDWEEAAFAGSTDLGRSAVAHVTRQGATPGGFLERPMRAHATHPRSIWEHSKLFPALCAERAAGRAPEMDSVRQAVALIGPSVSAGASVLDVGCGAGHAFRSLKGLGLEYHGIDSYARGIEIGRAALAGEGLPAARLRELAIEDLPPGEEYDFVLCLSTLGYFPQYHLPLEAMARAARRMLIVRASFGDASVTRFLPDVLLEPGFQSMRAYFQVWSRDEVASFLDSEGFRPRFVPDERQTQRFGGSPEVVGGIELPYEFLVAERVAPIPEENAVLGDAFRAAARAWREHGRGGPKV